MALARRRFRIEGFGEHRDFIRQLAGAVLMGTGGVFAMGCTVGQGLTGLSTLSLGSVLAALSIGAGGFLGTRLIESPVEIANERRAASAATRRGTAA